MFSKSAKEINDMLADDDGSARANYRFRDGIFQLLNVTNDKYHEVYVENVGGTATLKISETGVV